MLRSTMVIGDLGSNSVRGLKKHVKSKQTHLGNSRHTKNAKNRLPGGGDVYLERRNTQLQETEPLLPLRYMYDTI